MRDWQNDLYWNALAYGLVAGASLIALVGLIQFVPALRRRWLPMPRLRPGSWEGHEVFLAFCTTVGFPGLIIAILLLMGSFTPLIGPAPDVDAPGQAAWLYALRCTVISSPLTLTVTLGLMFTILFARSRCRPHHLGLSWSRWPANLGLGLATFLIATPLVLGVHALADLLTNLIAPTRPHPFAQLGEHPIDEWEWFFIGFQLTVAAPLLEEILFRGVLLGWLRRASLVGHIAILSATILVAAMGVYYIDPVTKESVFNASPVVFALLMAGGYVWFLFRLARRFKLEESEIQTWEPGPSPAPLEPSVEWSREESRRQDEQRFAAWRDANANLAIYGSAMLFAAFHGDAWPAPVALFLFALVAGYLARRTQNLIGPITFHALLNVVGFIALYGSVHYEFAKNGNAQTTAQPAAPAASAISVPASQFPLRK